MSLAKKVLLDTGEEIQGKDGSIGRPYKFASAELLEEGQAMLNFGFVVFP